MMAQSTATPESQYPLDFNDDTVAHVIESHGILDKAAFLHFANIYDEDQNGYLKLTLMSVFQRNWLTK